MSALGSLVGVAFFVLTYPAGIAVKSLAPYGWGTNFLATITIFSIAGALFGLAAERRHRRYPDA